MYVNWHNIRTAVEKCTQTSNKKLKKRKLKKKNVLWKVRNEKSQTIFNIGFGYDIFYFHVIFMKNSEYYTLL